MVDMFSLNSEIESFILATGRWRRRRRTVFRDDPLNANKTSSIVGIFLEDFATDNKVALVNSSAFQRSGKGLPFPVPYVCNRIRLDDFLLFDRIVAVDITSRCKFGLPSDRVFHSDRPGFAIA
jgi:hypothetical protein